MDLLDMVKMENYLDHKRGLTKTVKPMAKTATPAADAILARSNMLKSSADDAGTEFRFNKNQD